MFTAVEEPFSKCWGKSAREKNYGNFFFH